MGACPQVQDIIVLLVATVASEVWSSGAPDAAAQTLGGLELAFLLGFKGKALRSGRNNADDGAAAVQIFSKLQNEVANTHSGVGEQTHAIWLRKRLEALFPPPVRVTFQAVSELPNW